MTNNASVHGPDHATPSRKGRVTRAIAIVAATLFASSLIVETADARFGGGGFGGGGFGGGGMRGSNGGGGSYSGGGMRGSYGGGMRSTGGMKRATGGTSSKAYPKSTRSTRYPTKVSSYPKRYPGNKYPSKTTSDYPRHPRWPARHPPRWNYPPVITTYPAPYLPPVTTLPPNNPPPGFVSPPNQPPNAPPPGQGPVAQGPTNFFPPPPGENRFVPDEVLLSVPANITVPALDEIAQRNQLTRLDVREFTMTGRRLALMRINDGRPVANVVAALQAEAGIGGAQPNFLYSLEQSGGGGGSPDQYAYAKMNLPMAHSIARGNSIRVAVIDTPIDAQHPDLAGAVAASYDATGTGDRPHSHGTAIAGIIAAHGRLVGAAPMVQILGISAFSTRAATATSVNILKGLEWAGVSNADVVNMSFAGPADSELSRMVNALRRKGIVLVAAAGNKGPSSPPQYPAAERDVIAVTATDSDDQLFNMANRGGHIAVAAPGVSILVAAPNGSYNMESGTSMACAQVSGIAALLLERNRNLDPAAVRQILISTARDLGPAGHDDQFGAGLVDAYAALEFGAARASEVSAARAPN